jgi:uncharacterized membrane protein YdbT with pleckstrin-like domain
MGYVEDHLMPGERIIHETRLHWIAYGAAILFAALGLVGFVVSGGVGTVLLLLAGVCWLAAWLRISNSEFAVTDQRVMIKTGILSRRTLEILLSKVEALAFEQGLNGRLWGYGTIVINGTGGTREAFPVVAHPEEFIQQAQQEIARAQRTVASAGPAAIPGPSRDERDCPHCAERILARARVCKHCGRDVNPVGT